MVKAGEVRGPLGPQQLQNLQQKEAEQVKKEQTSKATSAADAARIASQAGFQRAPQKKGKLDVGDSSRSPIPLPDDDVSSEAWSSERLNGAQESLGLASAQFGEVAKGGEGGSSIGATVLASSYLPTEEDLAELEDLAKRPAPQPMPLEEVTTNVERLFNIKLDDDVPVGHKVLATGLVVAGEPGSVSVAKGRLDEQRLAGGIQKVTERGNQAVGQAQKMSQGISRELNVQRTFVFKR